MNYQPCDRMKVAMDYTEKILKNTRYKKQIDLLSSATLTSISEDQLAALEAARKGIEQVEPEKLNDVEYLQYIADIMQKLAQKVLEERTKK